MERLTVSPSPHIHSAASTDRIMLDVIIALVPALLVSFLFYGWSQLLVFVVCCAGCVATEWIAARYLMKRPGMFSGMSALVTGVLLAMNLPATAPWWVALTGAVVAIGIAKMSFGGLGQNLFNPAITGRVFLLLSFPVQMTNWSMPSDSFLQMDAITGATPLSVIKEGLKSGLGIDEILAANHMDMQMLLHDIGGSAGEISSLALLLGFIYLLVRKVVKPWIPLSILLTVALISGVFHAVNPEHFTGLEFNLMTGGVILGACFMATDYVTSPASTLGGIVFGVGIGLIMMMIRYFGSYPEGMSFAILIMNCFVPLIDRAFHQKKYGR
ncbi:MAG: RnfABCDGE type electron transport complex subunit D [Bacteroidales bacterium]|nr:RnfABCDGE type electron transport complex subunit D [Bacteroidales bacterium]